MDAPAKPAVAGVTGPTAAPLARVPVRTREGQVTTSAWRLEVAAAEGKGGIVRVEGPAGTHFRGDGLFLGWAPERLAEAYQRLKPPAEDESFETLQLG